MKSSPDFSRLLAVAGVFVGLKHCACLSQEPGEAQVNLLKKPTFEKASWEVKFFGSQGKVTKDSIELHDGHPSLRIDQATPPGVAFLNQKVRVKPRTRYRFSGWIKAMSKEQEGNNQWRPAGTAWFADISLVELGPAGAQR